MHGRVEACGCLAGAMVLVGSSVVAGKVMVAELPIFTASALRFGLALALLVPLLWCREGGLPRLARRSWGLLALQALAGSFLFTVFLLSGLRLTDAATAGILTSTTPAWMALLGWLGLGERPAPLILGAVALTVAGVLVLNAGAAPAGAVRPWFGNLLVLAAVVCEAAFLLLRKGVPEPLSPLAAATVVSGFGLFYFAPVALWELAVGGLPPAGIAAWLAVAYYGVFVTVLAYLLWFAGVVRVTAGVAAVFTGVMPVAALVLSFAVLGEVPQVRHLLGCGAVLAALGLIGLSPHHRVGTGAGEAA